MKLKHKFYYLDPSSATFPIPMKKHIGTRKEDASKEFETVKKSFLATRFLRRREGFSQRDALGKDGP